MVGLVVRLLQSRRYIAPAVHHRIAPSHLLATSSCCGEREPSERDQMASTSVFFEMLPSSGYPCPESLDPRLFFDREGSPGARSGRGISMVALVPFLHFLARKVEQAKNSCASTHLT
ncbi:hypothetical protein TWF694_008852 [Orbilia ellipsospora]|uniref:Uncharacterized protein n=1 Tax=Orbilia ellipsospora TaxID=2528407 RepID=A0AAV9XDX3_9PEZI